MESLKCLAYVYKQFAYCTFSLFLNLVKFSLNLVVFGIYNQGKSVQDHLNEVVLDQLKINSGEDRLW